MYEACRSKNVFYQIVQQKSSTYPKKRREYLKSMELLVADFIQNWPINYFLNDELHIILNIQEIGEHSRFFNYRGNYFLNRP